jgi:hypothetical protein
MRLDRDRSQNHLKINCWVLYYNSNGQARTFVGDILHPIAVWPVDRVYLLFWSFSRV